MSPRRRALTLAALLLLLPVTALADERPYVFAYEPVVSAGGETELEVYETYVRPPGAPASQGWWEHKLELGRGITDRLSLSGYLVTRTTPERAFEVSAFRAEGRYKLLDAGPSPVDLVLYLEGEKEIVDDKPWGVEEKVIFGRNHGRLGWTVNLIAEQEFPGGSLETKYGWNAGASAELVHGVKLGLESLGQQHRAVGGATDFTASLGPAVVFTLPAGTALNSAWLILGAQFGLNPATEDLQARAVLGCDF
jgi:hypothetical protein